MFLVQLVGYALLIPFFGWGIYLLRRRFLYFEESTVTLEVLTVFFVGFFFWVETLVLRQALTGQLLLYLAAILGLSMAGFALYAHVFISLLSRVVVDMVAPGQDTAVDQPRFGPVDALERQGDYDAALGEYLVLARIYPRNVEVLSRTANIHVVLERPAEAAEWYLRARKRAVRADDALEAVNSLCRLYDNELALAEKAEYQLARFIRDFPDSPDVDIVRDRLSRRANKTDWSVSDFLEAMDDEPAVVEVPADTEKTVPAPSVHKPAQVVELVSLEDEGAADKSDLAPEKRQSSSSSLPQKGPGVSLERLDDKGTPDSVRPKPKAKSKPKAKPKPKKSPKVTKKSSSTLESMDTAPSERKSPSPVEELEQKKPSGLGLEPLDDRET